MHTTESYHDNGQRHSGDFMFGLLCGAAVGAAVGILIAPRSGAELRRQLASSAERARKGAVNGYAHASNAVHSAIDRSRETVSEFANRGREVANDVLAQGQDVANDAIARGRDAAHDVLIKGKKAVSDTLEQAERVRRGRESEVS